MSYDPIIGGRQHVTYSRRPAPDELNFRDRVYYHAPLEEALRPGTKASFKKWLKGPDGRRYWRL